MSILCTPPSYFYPTEKTRASMPTEHWCEITQNTAPRLALSPRQNSHMQCQPRGRVYSMISSGSLQKNEVGQDTGSGVYHPHLNVSHYVNPKGMGITNTILRAELAAIATAVIHGYTHIATDSLTSLHQIKKQLSHPNLHRHHIQGDVLQSIVIAIRQSPSPTHFFKVKSHAGIIGNSLI